MANDNHANYAKIGFAIVLGVTAIIGTLIYLGGAWGQDKCVFIETCYDKPVSGLAVGSPVNFRGVKIGEVAKIGFIGDEYDVQGADNSRIYILMSLQDRYLHLKDGDLHEFSQRVKKFVDKLGLRATVTSSGITGLSRIECDFNVENPPEVPHISWTPRYAYVPPKMSLLDDFSVAATKVMNQINKMDLNIAWSNLNMTVSALAAASDNVRAMLESSQPDVERLLEDVSRTTVSVRELVTELKRNPSLLIRDRKVSPLEETE